MERLHLLTMVVLVVLLIAAITSDVKSRRIPNKLILIGLASGFIFQLLPGAQGAKAAVLGGLTGLAIFIPFYMLRTLGAGDVKLFAVVGVFLGVKPTLYAALWTMIAGGVLSLTWALCTGVLRQVLINLHAMCVTTLINAQTGGGLKVEAPTKTGRLPYAIAIAAGTLVEVARILTS